MAYMFVIFGRLIYFGIYPVAVACNRIAVCVGGNLFMANAQEDPSVRAVITIHLSAAPTPSGDAVLKNTFRRVITRAARVSGRSGEMTI